MPFTKNSLTNKFQLLLKSSAHGKVHLAKLRDAFVFARQMFESILLFTISNVILPLSLTDSILHA